MGVSFEVSKTGRRFRPKPAPSNAIVLRANDEDLNDAPIAASKQKTNATALSAARKLGDARENEVSFTLKLFPDGYSIGKPVENESGNQTSVDVPKLLHPYDRASEALFSAIESGRFPGDILDDIPCKYIDGTLVCEVRDYRKCFAGGVNVVSGESSAAINRVSLKMSLENIVKGIPSISENGWTYGDLMEVESRILKATQPQLCLDPSPQLDKLYEDPVQNKLNLEPHSMRRKRLRQISEANSHGKKASLDRVPESSRLGDTVTLLQQPVYENTDSQNNVPSAMLQLRSNSIGSDGSLLPSPMASHQSKYSGGGSSRMMKDHRTGALLNASVGSPGGQGMMIPFADNITASLPGKRENQDGQSSPLTNKKARLPHTGAEGNIQHLGSQVDTLHGSELHWKNTLMQQQSIGRGMQYTDDGMQKFPQQVFEGVKNQVGGPDGRVAMGETELANIDSQQPQLQQRVPHQMMRSGLPQSPWNNLGQPLDNNSRKEDPFQKRKLVQSPRVSGGGLPQSPLSSRSGEFSSGSMGHQFGAAVTSGLVSQKDKSAVTSVGVGGNPTFTSSANDSVQRQLHAQAAAKRRSNSLPKTPAISGVGSPASVGNMSIPINARCPPVGSQALGDLTTEKFSKIETVAMRYQLNCKKGKDDAYPMRKPSTYSTQQLMSHLSSDSNNENLKDKTCQMPLSQSLVGGSMNACKTRILNFIQTQRILQGNTFQVVPKSRTRMIMSEKPDDGAVAIHIGEIEDAEYLAAEDYLLTLPNNHMANLLAVQYSKLMIREGYHMEDHVQPKPVCMIPNPGTSTPGIAPNSAAPENMQQFSEGVSLQQSSDVAKPSDSGNSTSLQNIQGPRMLSPGSTKAIQISQGLPMPQQPQQPEQLQPMQQQPQQPQQHPQFQKMLSTNQMQHPNNIAQNANMQLGPQMTNKTTALEFQLMQQQQLLQPQQQSAVQRKMMSGLGNVGMDNISSNMVGLGVGGLGNATGIGGARGVSGSGISAPMGSMPNKGNMNQNPMNLTSAASRTNGIRSGALTPQHAASMKMKMGNQNRANMLGNLQSSTSSTGGIPGARQMHPRSAVSMRSLAALNRANMSQMQRTTMGPPKVPEMNLNINQQQQQHQLQQHQQHHQLQQPQQQQQQQQQLWQPQQQLHLQQLQQQQQQQLQRLQQLQLQQLQQLRQQQQQQLRQQQQQQQQLQQLQQHPQPQQQETTSPFQAVVSPPQVRSPPSVGMPRHMNQQQPQQMSQRTPMSPQLSSGAIHPMGAGNPEACPASTQLSSQTMGSVGSITNSPMELQGVNKSNFVNNT
ncbi:protein PHYTOCHROME-DEPENDENT LATE-FLOWERING-like [Salvia divinorum]|uniref:Protein PHYTOCHROME-DEPENDENT LATE-FLOWERING-like n=1 Tax=Salvia divinorum TaxID=28513 RepID=A0ABD1G1V5_SALDI